eukprot:scaffold68738_cov37-Tisochrysis_lutea.AAC.1
MAPISLHKPAFARRASNATNKPAQASFCTASARPLLTYFHLAQGRSGGTNAPRDCAACVRCGCKCAAAAVAFACGCIVHARDLDPPQLSPVFHPMKGRGSSRDYMARHSGRMPAAHRPEECR